MIKPYSLEPEGRRASIEDIEIITIQRGEKAKAVLN